MGIKPSIAKTMNESLNRPQTMRSHLGLATLNGMSRSALPQNTTHGMRRTVIDLPFNKKDIFINNKKPHKNTLSDIENMIASDPNRTKHDDIEQQITYKRRKAGSLTTLDLEKIDDHQDEEEQDQIVENEIEQIIEEKIKREKKEEDVLNAIEASLGN